MVIIVYLLKTMAFFVGENLLWRIAPSVRAGAVIAIIGRASWHMGTREGCYDHCFTWIQLMDDFG